MTDRRTLEHRPALDSPRERKLREEAARHRRVAGEYRNVAREYALRELERLVSPIMPFSLFEELIGAENVLDSRNRINLGELVWRINAKHEQVPQIVLRRVSREHFEQPR